TGSTDDIAPAYTAVLSGDGFTFAVKNDGLGLAAGTWMIYVGFRQGNRLWHNIDGFPIVVF
ncbi:MAG: hypothetical protein AB8B95_15190, partial [Pseudohongiellaceae bacterium]